MGQQVRQEETHTEINEVLEPGCQMSREKVLVEKQKPQANHATDFEGNATSQFVATQIQEN